MRAWSGRKFLAPLAIGLVLSSAACAAPGTAASASTALVTRSAAGTSSSPTLESAAPSDSVTAGSAKVAGPAAPVSTATVGTQATIPSAPGTAGSTAQPPPISAAPVSSAAGVVVTAELPACTPANLKTVAPGKLTFATGPKRQAPWFLGADPGSGRGYESAVAAALAKQLGYAPDAISWTTADPTKVVLGKATGFDVAVDEFATPDQMSGRVDYSTGYFGMSDSVVASSAGVAARTKNLAELEKLKVATISGTTAAAATRASQIPATARSYPSGSA